MSRVKLAAWNPLLIGYEVSDTAAVLFTHTENPTGPETDRGAKSAGKVKLIGERANFAVADCPDTTGGKVLRVSLGVEEK